LLAVVVVVKPVGAGKQGQVLDLVFQLDLFECKRVAGILLRVLLLPPVESTAPPCGTRKMPVCNLAIIAQPLETA